MKYLNIFIFLISFLFMISLVSGADTLTISTPAQDTSISGSYIIEAVMDTNAINVSNVSFYYQLSGSTTWVSLGTTTNTTNGQLSFNNTFDTTSIIDDNQITFNATGINLTGDFIGTDLSTGVDNDNGNPTASFASNNVDTKTDIRDQQNFKISITADTTIGISNCTVVMNASSNVITASNNACSADLQANLFNITNENDYSYYVTVEDGNGNITNTSTRSLSFHVGALGGGSYVFKDNNDNSIDEKIDTTKESSSNKIGKVISNISKSFIEFFKRIFGILDKDN